jgi:sulfur carrier protein ThiS
VNNHPVSAELQLDPPLVQHRRLVQIPPGQTLHQVLDELDLHPAQPVIPLVNGVVADLSYELQPGDSVRFLAQISGGSFT